jgi:hypothetical protein
MASSDDEVQHLCEQFVNKISVNRLNLEKLSQKQRFLQNLNEKLKQIYYSIVKDLGHKGFENFETLNFSTVKVREPLMVEKIECEPKKVMRSIDDMKNKLKCVWPQCKYLALNKYCLDLHILTHLGKNKFKCDFENCGKSFKQKPNFVNHQKIHFGGKKLSCDWPQCYLKFTTKQSLELHKTNIHLGVKEFECHFEGCHKKFTKKHNLVIHLGSHSGEKPFSCNYKNCYKTFSTKFYLKIHKKRHEGLKNFKCDYNECFSSFVTFNELKRHISLSHKKEKLQ